MKRGVIELSFFMELTPISSLKRATLIAVSFLIVAFGQPAWIGWLGPIAASFGYALFWKVLLDLSERKQRFLISLAWFAAVQVIQLSWATSHPYLFIYIVYAFFSLSLGAQFGLIGMLITPARIQSISQIVAISAIWTLFEWSRLFFLSGYSWNPIGLSLTGSLYALQGASLLGIYGLSFWVMIVNLLALRAWSPPYYPSVFAKATWLCAALLPYIYGFVHLTVHNDTINSQEKSSLNVMLVQTNFPAETEANILDKKQWIAHALGHWKEILTAAKKQAGKPIDLIVLPEYAVPCGTYSCVYPEYTVIKMLEEMLGKDSLKALPSLESPFVQEHLTKQGIIRFVNNAFLAQTLANYFKAGLVMGLEDVEEVDNGKYEHYSAALYFIPSSEYKVRRYEKRVLVPLGEYIPFSLVAQLAANYGIQGSFTCGKSAKVFQTLKGVPFGVSICYEETFGHLMRENRLEGADLLVNLTSDAWYPHSRLAKQHFDHARLRTVENGIPLIRASNIGVTGAVDSLGRVIATLGEDTTNPDWKLDSIRVEVPTYTYSTLYSRTGDSLIIGFCFLASIFFLPQRQRKGL